MNFLPAEVLADAGQGAVRLGDGTALPLASPRPDLAGRRIVLGIRPNHVAHAATGEPGAGIARQQVVVDLIQPTGARSFIDFRLGGSEVTAEMGAYDAMRPGEALAVDIDMTRAIIIDPESGLVV